MTDSVEYIVDLTDVEKTTDHFKFMFIESIPLKQRIVRCRDCVYSAQNGTRCYHWMTLDIFENPIPSDVEPGGFCWKAERKVDA